MLDSGHPVLEMDAYVPESSFSEEFCLVTSAQGGNAGEEDDPDEECDDAWVVMKKGARKKVAARREGFDAPRAPVQGHGSLGLDPASAEASGGC